MMADILVVRNLQVQYIFEALPWVHFHPLLASEIQNLNLLHII